ncbi:Serine/threonine-protein kinase PknH [Actinomadura rubteroloni]|uniref:non-specific serine/threonine protein kinase n=1 Tax=Actinomadura rubteroloni TaxID=1926885 RepID=A0A2P4UHU3_9ACTN|nr:serine/threonine-protein kinase [Actinomadura rubteroloni]POM24635.1 Serine/threonine-protein kinase PknH [Actinomadura rubteroloni]
MTDWRVPGYSELGELGRGGQGRVVLARHDATGRTAAIKYLAPDLAADATFRDRLRDEAGLLSRLDHPHVTRLYGLVEAGDGAAIVMEAVDGVPLRTVLDERAPLAPEAALAVLSGSLRGLAAAHALGIVHRDYKPANVIVRADGLSKLIDFGIAADAGAADRSGTPAYMAPEQWRGEPASPATDVYAATAVFYECVTGHKPFSAPNRATLMNAHLGAPVPLDGLPPGVRPLVERGLAKDPWSRPAGAAAFAAELAAAAGAAYGPDWEHRGARALAGAAATVAAAFPLAALGLAPAGSAASAGAGAGAAGQGAALAGIGGAKGAALAAGAAVAVAAAGGGAVYVATRDEAKPPALAYTTAALNEPGDPLTLTGTLPRVTGGRAGLAQKINAALRAPVDARAADYRKGLAQFGPSPTKMIVKPAYLMRGPRYLSVKYEITQQGERLTHSTWARARTVTVDLATGRAVPVAAIFLPAGLTASGLRTFVERLRVRPDSNFACLEETAPAVLTREQLEGRDGAVQLALEPDDLHVMVDLVALGGITACGQDDLRVPYSELTGLVNPQVTAAPTPKRS